MDNSKEPRDEELPRGFGGRDSFEAIANRRVKHAREMFTATVAHHGNAIQSRVLAKMCFANADAFAEIEAQYLAGELEEVEDFNPLDDAFAPNLKKNHPCNMVSRRFGSMDLVKKHLLGIRALDRTAAKEVAQGSHAAIVYEDAGWTFGEVNQAEALFPSLIEKAGRMEREKAIRDKANAMKQAAKEAAATN